MQPVFVQDPVRDKGGKLRPPQRISRRKPAECQNALIEALHSGVTLADALAFVRTAGAKHVTCRTQPDEWIAVQDADENVHIGDEIRAIAAALEKADAQPVMRAQVKC